MSSAKVLNVLSIGLVFVHVDKCVSLRLRKKKENKKKLKKDLEIS